MKKLLIYISVLLLTACGSKTTYSEDTVKNDLRAPAYPLIMLHPHVRIWSTADCLNEKDMTFTNGKALPFVGLLRVDGVMYRFMGSKELPMQAIAPMAFDGEKWEGKFTFLIPEAGWEQPSFNDEYWQVGEGAFGTPDIKEVKTKWYSSNIWVRREVKVDPYLLKHKKLYLRYSHDDVFELYINGIKIVDTGYRFGQNFKIELPQEVIVERH